MLKMRMAALLDAPDPNVQEEDDDIEIEAAPEIDAAPVTTDHSELLEAIVMLGAHLKAVHTAIEGQSSRLDQLVSGQKALLKAVRARKRLVYDDDGRPVAAEIVA